MTEVFLTIKFDRQARVGFASKNSVKRLEDKAYQRLTPEGCIGHVDWLRNSLGIVIGVRLWYFNDDTASVDAIGKLIECVKEYRQVRIDPERCVAIFFSALEVEFDDDLSQDQCLDDAAILYRREGHIFLIYFQAENALR